ncbi:hypothetical protein FB45DRAFT_882233 [Roridomyces roridus]|uniref:Nephrocystin 3-like N-terminal domain-containing protein n=1 Tax=Roridomyces roridus TaxID=1738132 RepID=A0AAD7F840_9AGAR|nr:hypothetical protein FB45DRAFT_882233 [Roridomyces roridus]
MDLARRRAGYEGFDYRKEMSEYESLQQCFNRWTSQFSQKLGVESLKILQSMQETMRRQREFYGQSRAAILDSILPEGVDRPRPVAGCMPGTRKALLEQIQQWLLSRDLPNILWIKGFPGSGKSALSRTLVENTKARGILVSSFFERDGDAFMSPSSMVRKLSADLADGLPAFRDALLEDLQTRGTVDWSTASIADQFHRLVEKPLRSLAPETPVVIVLDALDECGGLEKHRLQDQRDVLEIVEKWGTFSPSFRLVVTSREEPSMSEVLGPISTVFELSLGTDQAISDIETLLKREFRRIAKRYYLPSSWPARSEIEALARRANRLFVWAATLIKFVDGVDAEIKLHQILAGEVNLRGDITELYQMILKISFYPEGQKLPETFLSAFQRQPVVRNSSFGSIEAQDDEEHTLRFDHQSFVDFLMSRSQCPSDFRIKPRKIMKMTALALLDTLNRGLEFNLCGFQTSYQSNPRVESANRRIDPRIRYASHFWAHALCEDTRGDEEILACLKVFFEKKFPYWLEVLSVTGKMSGALTQLRGASRWLGVHELEGISRDAIEFVKTFQECLSKSAPHVYVSALAFTLKTSKIYQMYSHLFVPCATVEEHSPSSLREGRTHIPTNIVHCPQDSEFAKDFEGHVDEILSVLFTQDGYAVSSSYDATIRFWDPRSGKPVLTPFEVHDKPVTSLAEAPAAKILVAGSRDHKVSIWNTKKHKQIGELLHAGPVTQVAVSPSGTVVMTACKDNVVRFWSVATERKCRSSFHGHTSCVTAIVFLSDGTALSASEDRTIYSHRLSGHSEILLTSKFPIHSLAVEKSVLAAACYSCIAVWQLSENKAADTVFYLAENSHQLRSVAIKGKMLAAAIGNTIEVWDIGSLKRVIGPLEGHREMVTCLAFSEDGRRLITGSMDHSVRIWDTQTSQIIGGFQDGSRLRVESGWIRGPEPQRDLVIWVPKVFRKRICWGRALAVMDGRPMRNRIGISPPAKSEPTKSFIKIIELHGPTLSATTEAMRDPQDRVHNMNYSEGLGRFFSSNAFSNASNALSVVLLASAGTDMSASFEDCNSSGHSVEGTPATTSFERKASAAVRYAVRDSS